MKIIHHIRARLAKADRTLTVEDAVNALTARREVRPESDGDRKSGLATAAKHPPKAKP